MSTCDSLPRLSPADQRLVINVAYDVCVRHDDLVQKPCPGCLRVVRKAVVKVRDAEADRG